MSTIDEQEIQLWQSPQNEVEKWLTAFLRSRTLAQYSTGRDAGGLYCRVRNGTGCYAAAMAVIPKLGISD